MAIPLCNMVAIPCLLLFYYVSTVRSLNFSFPRFDNNSGIIFEGDAYISKEGAIELSRKFDSPHNHINRAGWASFRKPITLWDSATKNLSNFTTHFTFSINTYSAIQPGAGIAFFLAPVGFESPLYSGGGLLGLFSDEFQSKPIVFVEFDTHHEWWDPDFEHVGINVNHNLTSNNYTRWEGSSRSGETCNVKITYNSTTKSLGVYWTYEENPIYEGNSSLSYEIDLMNVLPETVMVGFSAAVGLDFNSHTLKSWEFHSDLQGPSNPLPSPPLNPLPSPPLNPPPSQHDMKAELAVGLSVGAVFICVAVVGLIISKKPRDTKNPEDDTASLNPLDHGEIEKGVGPKSFSYKNLVTATNNFSSERKLGQGGFGGVYQGTLSDTDQPIAVKKFLRGSSQGKKEFVNEVTTISRLRHRNLLQLIGWCHEKEELILVYELMPNGSLDSHLFGKKGPLDWVTRYKIALGLASALLYLHEEWEQCVLHRDIKSSNVMLDARFNAKLGDFGLARFMDHDRFSQSTGCAGTFGYLAPEYIITGRPSKDSDVFSFGVVALEIVCGRKSFTSFGEISNTGLVEMVWDLYGRGELSVAVDKKLGNDYDDQEAERLMILGLWCAHPDRSFRPSIRQAIQVLNEELSLPNLPPKMPVPLYYVPELLLPSISTSLDDGR